MNKKERMIKRLLAKYPIEIEYILKGNKNYLIHFELKRHQSLYIETDENLHVTGGLNNIFEELVWQEVERIIVPHKIKLAMLPPESEYNLSGDNNE